MPFFVVVDVGICYSNWWALRATTQTTHWTRIQGRQMRFRACRLILQLHGSYAPQTRAWVTVAQYIYKTDVNQQFRGAFDLSAFMMTMLMMYTQRPPLVLCSRHVYECTTCVVSARAPVCNLQFRFVCI